MGFRHIVKSDITGVSDINGFSTDYTDSLVGEGEDTDEMFKTYSVSNGTLYLRFTFNIPQNATVISTACNVAVNTYKNGNPSRNCALYNGGHSISNNVSWGGYGTTANARDYAYIEQTSTSSYLPTATDVNNGALKVYCYVHGSNTVGLMCGATMYVEYEDDTPENHGIFNLILPR